MKKISALLGVMIMAVTISGCGQTIPDLTDEENKIITTYIANLILDYHSSTKSRLLIEDEIEVENIVPDENVEEKVEPEIDETVEDETVVDNLETDQQEQEQSNQSSITDIAQVLTPGNYSISSLGYKDVDIYMANDGFGLVPKQGNKLLIVQYEVANIGEQSENVNFFQDSMKSILTINEQYKSNHMMSILANDMITLDVTLEPGESKDVFIAFEIPKDLAESINKLSMKVTTNIGTAIIEIK